VYRIVIISLSLSICFASDDIQSRMDKLMKSLQEKYQVYSLEDLENLTFHWADIQIQTLSIERTYLQLAESYSLQI